MTSGGGGEALRLLLRAIAALYRSADGDAREMLAVAARELDGAAPPAHCGNSFAPLPVHAHLDAALAAGRGGPLGDISDRFAAVARSQAWTQNSNYVAAPPRPGFLDGYGYVEWVGPGRLIDTDLVRVGILMLGPGVLYPSHAHPADEVYHVVAGRARWQRGEGHWRAEPPGAAIHHLPHVVHATATADEPLLALYCWAGDIGPAASVVQS